MKPGHIQCPLSLLTPFNHDHHGSIPFLSVAQGACNPPCLSTKWVWKVFGLKPDLTRIPFSLLSTMSEVSEKYAGPALAMVASAIAIVLVRNKLRSRHPPYPPGPQRYPIIGNLLDFPRNPIWEGFSRMAQEHGE